MKEGVPKLPGDHTPNEQMLYALVLLITQKTLIWMLKASTSQAISSPAPIMSD